MDMADWTIILAVLAPLLGVFVPLIIHLNNRMDKKFEILMARMDTNKKDTDQKSEFNHKELEHKIEATQKILEQKIDSNQKENNVRFNAIENRLTSMEVEIKNTNQRLSTIEGYLVPRKVFRFEEPHHDPDEPKEN